uniref:long-chain-fatty-acid--CoA ligase n=1 Tax=Takifugu rubripes TaxID=31033 RepID=A0A674PM25_TAKRU
MEMIATVLTSVFGGLLALLLYQRAYFTLWWKDLLYYFKLRQHKKRLQARLQLGIVTYLDCFLQQTRKTPSKPFIIFEDQVLTYQDVDRRSNRFANVLRRETQVTPGAMVALWMFNHPDFICVWLGLCKLGCQAAFLNTNIKPKTLAHCMHSCGAQLLLVSCSEQVVFEARLLPPRAVLESWTGPTLRHLSCVAGLSKAARVAHLKAISSMIFFQMCGATSQDIIYITLPLYHMSASLLGIGGCIQLGATCVLKRKFSASQFWKDCVKYNVTVIEYIGELCRYLVNHPSVPEEKAHKVHLAAGSGLRSDVWKEFRHRFGKITIREGYGLTEASIGFLNYTDEVGPIGRASCLNKLFMPFELLRFDPQTYEPVRTVAGRCLRAQRGEAGILVAPLVAVSQFLGYAGDKAQSEKKLLRDVLKAGDIYFNTGDLLFLDKRGFLYFHDRVGDTFRWKGENVSTTEVSEVLGLLEFIQEANVYGVTIPGCEGRAGMAAVVLKQDHHLDGKRLHKHLVKTLPAYAWPRFLRIQNSLDITETFKQQKTKLVQEAFNPCVIQDPLYFLHAPQEDFIPLTASLYHSIVSGEILL